MAQTSLEVFNLPWLIDFIDRRRHGRVEVSFRAHPAWADSQPEPIPVYCFNLQNRSPEREITVTHAWIACEPPVPLPMLQQAPRVKPSGDQFETCVPRSAVPVDVGNVERLGRVRLGDDTELKSVPRDDVPPAGYVPGW